MAPLWDHQEGELDLKQGSEKFLMMMVVPVISGLFSKHNPISPSQQPHGVGLSLLRTLTP